MPEHEDMQDPIDIGTSLQQQFSKTLSDMLKSSSSSDTEAMQVQHMAARVASPMEFVQVHTCTLYLQMGGDPQRCCATPLYFVLEEFATSMCSWSAQVDDLEETKQKATGGDNVPGTDEAANPPEVDAVDMHRAGSWLAEQCQP
jgi:hypothetical protein